MLLWHVHCIFTTSSSIIGKKTQKNLWVYQCLSRCKHHHSPRRKLFISMLRGRKIPWKLRENNDDHSTNLLCLVLDGTRCNKLEWWANHGDGKIAGAPHTELHIQLLHRVCARLLERSGNKETLSSRGTGQERLLHRLSTSAKGVPSAFGGVVCVLHRAYRWPWPSTDNTANIFNSYSSSNNDSVFDECPQDWERKWVPSCAGKGGRRRRIYWYSGSGHRFCFCCHDSHSTGSLSMCEQTSLQS